MLNSSRGARGRVESSHAFSSSLCGGPRGRHYARMARLRQNSHRDRQVGAAHDRLAGRRAALCLAGVDRAARLRHAGRPVHAVPHGEGPLQPRVGRRADAAFDLLHQAGHAIHGTEHTRNIGRPASHGCVRLEPENARVLFNMVKQEGMANVRVVLSGATGSGGAGDGAARASSTIRRDMTTMSPGPRRRERIYRGTPGTRIMTTATGACRHRRRRIYMGPRY